MACAVWHISYGMLDESIWRWAEAAASVQLGAARMSDESVHRWHISYGHISYGMLAMAYQ